MNHFKLLLCIGCFDGLVLHESGKLHRQALEVT